ncbi:unnamed protein product [Larinioides sclopetarius]|uniref:C2H2-type domain-containing protein n=1 Tax=Larinioides sclopetarius TaxID=280406 RepID=A0AAV2AK68_9ARAC
MTGIGITPKMVKVTIKRADDSPDSEKWVCKRIDVDSELESTKETAHDASKSLTVDDQNLNEESEDSENWYNKIPLYLEIEMQEAETPQPSSGISTNNNTTVLETADNPRNSCSDPRNLSISYSKHISERNVTNNASNKSPFREQSTQSKFLQNAYDDFPNTASLTGSDRIVQGVAAPYFPRDMRSQNTSLTPDQRQMNSEGVVDMAMRTMSSSNQNSAMAIEKNSPVTSGFVNLEKPEIVAKGNIPNRMQQEALRFQMANYWNFVADARKSNISPYSDANRSYNWPLTPENNAKVLPIRNECAERIGENLAKNLPLKSTNNYKRLSQTCAQIGSNEVPGTIYHCNVCDVTFKTENGYRKHFLTEKHLRKVNQSDQKQPSLNNFQPNSVSRPSVSNIQPQPHPHLHYLMGNQMQYQMSQAHANTASKQCVGGGTISNTDVQKSHPRTSNSDCSDEFLDQNRSQNDRETKFYAQDPRYMNQPVNQSSNPQDNFLHPKDPNSKNSMVNPRYLGNKAPQSTWGHNDPSSQMQPENSRTGRSMDKPDSCAIKPNQVEKLTGVSFSQKSGFAQSVPPHQFESFQIFHCLVCSKFQSNDLREVERHISIIRNRTPFELITTFNKNLYCKLCDFETKTSVEMVHHCTSRIHVERVDYYNHVMEGGIQAREKLKNFHVISPISLFCAACDFTTRSLDTLKAHQNELSHLHNGFCYIYVSKFSPAVEYCYCRLCNVKTPTKRELLLHVRSRMHVDTLQQHPSDRKAFCDPADLYFIKELNLNIKEVPRVSEQTKGNLFIEREKIDSRKENNEKNVDTESPAPLDLSSTSSNSLKSLPVSCPLCQIIFQEVNVMLQHLQQIHGVNEAGVKWVISQITKVHEEKSLPTKEQRNIEIGKPKGIVLVPQRSFAADETLPIAGGQIIESKSSKCLKDVTSLQNLATDENLNKKRRTDTNFSASQQLDKTELMQNPDKLGLNLEERTGKDFSSSQRIGKSLRTRRKRNDSSSNENNTPSKRQFCKTENMLPLGEEKPLNSEENLNSSSSQADAKVIVEYESELNGRKLETETDNFSRGDFSASEHGSPILSPDHNASRERNDSSSSENNTGTPEWLLSMDDSSPFHSIPITQSGPIDIRERSDSSSSENDSLTPERLLAVYDSSIAHTSPKTQLNLKASRELYESPSSDHNSVSHEQLPSAEDSETDHSRATSPVLQSDSNKNREWYDVLSSDHNSVSHNRSPLRDKSSSYDNRSQKLRSGLNASREKKNSLLSDYNSINQQRSPSLGNFDEEHDSPKSQSGLKARRKVNDSSCNDISIEYEWLTERKRVNSSPKQHYLLESEKKSSHLEDKEMLPLRANVVNDSPISRLTGPVESKQEANISVKSKNSDDSVNAQIMLYEYPNEYEAEFSALNFPAALDLQMQARKSIENIEISNVISLASSVENSNNNKEKEKGSDSENIVFSDLEEL